jgi:hypothetical protein
MQKKAPNDANWLDRSPTHLVHRVAQCASDVSNAEVFQARVDEHDLTPRQSAFENRIGWGLELAGGLAVLGPGVFLLAAQA